MTTPTPPPSPADELIARLQHQEARLAQGGWAVGFEPRKTLTDAIDRLTTQQRELAKSPPTPANGMALIAVTELSTLHEQLAAANARVAEQGEATRALFAKQAAHNATLRTELARVTAENEKLWVGADKAQNDRITELETALAAAQADKERGSVQAFFNGICSGLPDTGWRIIIECEYGSVDVKLINPDGDERNMWEDETGIEQQVANAIRDAATPPCAKEGEKTL